MMVGMWWYIGLFFGMVERNKMIMGYVFGFVGGMGKSFVDGGSYGSLMEGFGG